MSPDAVDAVVVGAGFGGLYMAHRLRHLGLTVQGFDAAGGFGGTWWWNRYPGARCDIPSLFYAYTSSAEVQQEWRWSEKYAPPPRDPGQRGLRRRQVRPEAGIRR